MSSRKINLSSKNHKPQSTGKPKAKKTRKEEVSSSSSSDGDDDDSVSSSSDSSISSEDSIELQSKKSLRSKKKQANEADSKRGGVKSMSVIRGTTAQSGAQASSLRVIPAVDQSASQTRNRRRSQSVKIDNGVRSRQVLSELEEVNVSSEESPKKKNKHLQYPGYPTFSSRIIPAASPLLLTSTQRIKSNPIIAEPPRKKLFSSTIIARQIVDEKKEKALIKLREASNHTDQSIWMDALDQEETDSVIETQPKFISNKIQSILKYLQQPISVEEDTSESLSNTDSHQKKPTSCDRLLGWIKNNHLFRQDHLTIVNIHLRQYMKDQIIDWTSTILFSIFFVPLIFSQLQLISFSNISATDFLTSYSRLLNDESTSQQSIICYGLFLISLASITAIRFQAISHQQQVKEQSPLFSSIFEAIPWRVNSKQTANYLAHYHTSVSQFKLENHFAKNYPTKFKKSIFKGMVCIILSLAVILSGLLAPLLIQQTLYSTDVEHNKYIVSFFTGFFVILSTNILSYFLFLILKVTQQSSSDFQIWTAFALESIILVPVLIYMALHVAMLEYTDDKFYWLTRQMQAFPCSATQLESSVIGLFAGSIMLSLIKCIVHFTLRLHSTKINFLIENSMKSQQFFLLACSGFISYFAFPIGLICGVILLKMENKAFKRAAIDPRHGLPAWKIPLGSRLIGIILFATALMKVDIQISQNTSCGIYNNGSISKAIFDLIDESDIASAAVEVMTSPPLVFMLAIVAITNSVSSTKFISTFTPHSALHLGRKQADQRSNLLAMKLQQIQEDLNKLLPRSARVAHNTQFNNSNTNNNRTHEDDDQNHEKDDFNMNQHHDVSFAQVQPLNNNQPTPIQKRQFFTAQKAKGPFMMKGISPPQSKIDTEEMKKTSDGWSTSNQSPLLRQGYQYNQTTDYGIEDVDSRIMQKSHNQINKSSFNNSFK